MLREHPGNVVVLSGRNRGKIDRIVASVDGGLNVLADKPWILKSEDLPKVEQALAEADKRGVVAYDIMTERFEVTTILQRALVNDRGTFGELIKGTEAEPARLHGERPPPDEGRGRRAEHPAGVVLRHRGAGRRVQRHRHAPRRSGAVDALSRPGDRLPRRRPGAGGAAVADMDPRGRLSTRDRRGHPQALMPRSNPSSATQGLMRRMIALEYYCNTLVSYTLRGVHVKLNVIWDWEAPAGADTHFAFYRGTRARVEIRQTRADKYRPELYVIPADPASKAAVLAAVRAKLTEPAARLPGRRRRGSRRRAPRHDPRCVPRRPRSPLRAGDDALSALPAGSQGAAHVGTPQHAGEVFRDDDRHRVEPPEPASCRDAYRAAVVASRAGQRRRAVR